MRIAVFLFFALFIRVVPAFCYDYELNPSGDTFVDSVSLEGDDRSRTNYSDSNRLWVGQLVNPGTGSIDANTRARSYLKFDLSSIDNVDTAFLRLYCIADDWDFNDGYAPGAITVYRELAPWNVSTITWDNAPGDLDPDDFSAFPHSTLIAGNSASVPYLDSDLTDGVWVQWNVSSFAKQAEGGTLSLLLADESNPFHIFYSSEASLNQPKLVVNVVPEPVSCLLFGLGGLSMLGVRRIFKR